MCDQDFRVKIFSYPTSRYMNRNRNRRAGKWATSCPRNGNWYLSYKDITVLKLKGTKADNLSRPNKKLLIFWISNSHSSSVEVIHNTTPSSIAMVLKKWETPMNDDNLRTILRWLIPCICFWRLTSVLRKTKLKENFLPLVDKDAALHRQNNDQPGQKDASWKNGTGFDQQCKTNGENYQFEHFR